MSCWLTSCTYQIHADFPNVSVFPGDFEFSGIVCNQLSLWIVNNILQYTALSCTVQNTVVRGFFYSGLHGWFRNIIACAFVLSLALSCYLSLSLSRSCSRSCACSCSNSCSRSCSCSLSIFLSIFLSLSLFLSLFGTLKYQCTSDSESAEDNIFYLGQNT